MILVQSPDKAVIVQVEFGGLIPQTRTRNTIGQRGAIRSRLLLALTCGENFLPILGSRFHNHFEQPLKCWHQILMVQPDYFRPPLCRSHLWLIHALPPLLKVPTGFLNSLNNKSPITFRCTNVSV